MRTGYGVPVTENDRDVPKSRRQENCAVFQFHPRKTRTGYGVPDGGMFIGLFLQDFILLP